MPARPGADVVLHDDVVAGLVAHRPHAHIGHLLVHEQRAEQWRHRDGIEQAGQGRQRGVLGRCGWAAGVRGSFLLGDGADGRGGVTDPHLATSGQGGQPRQARGLAGGVEAGGGVLEHHGGRVLGQQPGHGQAQALGVAQPDSSVGDGCVVALRELFDERVGTGRARRVHPGSVVGGSDDLRRGLARQIQAAVSTAGVGVRGHLASAVDVGSSASPASRSALVSCGPSRVICRPSRIIG